MSLWEPEVEAAPPAETRAMCEAAWREQRERLVASGFYRGKLGSDIGRAELPDLDALPFTTKAELKAAQDDDPPYGPNLCVRPEALKRIYQTSGTSGTPSVLALTDADQETWTRIGARSYHASGISQGSAVLSTYGAGPFVAGHTQFAIMRIGARAVPVGPGDTERVVFGLRSGLADTLLATPSFAQYLANLLEPEPAPRLPALRRMVTGGEPGGGIPAVRDHIERVLDCKVSEAMGIGDVAPSLYGECEEQQGMHFCGTGLVWPELVEPDSGAPVGIEPGAVGELVYTHLRREAMPVVRFRSGDIARIEGTSCACGRTSFRMRCIGRQDDMIIVRGVNVYPTAVLAIVGEFRPQVTGRARLVRRAAAVAVEPPVPVEVEVPAGSVEDGALAARIESAVRAHLNFRCQVELVPEGAFGDAGYKTRLTRAR